jgi:hypothetical protein
MVRIAALQALGLARAQQTFEQAAQEMELLQELQKPGLLVHRPDAHTQVVPKQVSAIVVEHAGYSLR